MEKKKKSCFVTVGTTQFDTLIKTLDSIQTLETLLAAGVSQLILQVGNGSNECKVLMSEGGLEQFIFFKLFHYRLLIQQIMAFLLKYFALALQ